MTSHIRHGVPAPRPLRLGGRQTGGDSRTRANARPAKRDMKEKSRQNGRRMPKEDASEFGVVRVISRPAPDAEDRLRRLFTLLLEHAARERQGSVREAFPPRRGSRWRRHRGGSLMQPESFPTDDSLGRSVQPASAPLSAKEGAFGEENAPYKTVFGDVSKIIDAARESAVRSVNAAMTAAYWLIGRRIVEFEQSGEERAEYGAALIERLAEDLTGRFDRGFSRQNVQNMRLFYLSYPIEKIRQTLSGKLPASPRWRIRQTPSGKSEAASIELGFDDLLEGLSAALVSLRATAVGQERERPRVLRDRGAARRMVGPPARPADRLPVLRANGPLEEQGRHADGRTEEAPRRPRSSRRTDQGPLRPGVPRPQGRVLRERPGGGAHPPTPGVIPPGDGRRHDECRRTSWGSIHYV